MKKEFFKFVFYQLPMREKSGNVDTKPIGCKRHIVIRTKIKEKGKNQGHFSDFVKNVGCIEVVGMHSTMKKEIFL